MAQAAGNTSNHSGSFSIFSQTANKINEAGLGVTLDFTSNAESVDMSAKANNKNLFSGITADLAFSWSGQNGTLVPGAVEYTSPVPEPGMLGMLGVGRYADFTAVSANPYQLRADQLRTLTIRMTVVAGRVTFDARGAEPVSAGRATR